MQGTTGSGNFSNGFLALFMARSLSFSSRYQFFEAPWMKHARETGSKSKKKKEEGLEEGRQTEMLRQGERGFER